MLGSAADAPSASGCAAIVALRTCLVGVRTSQTIPNAWNARIR